LTISAPFSFRKNAINADASSTATASVAVAFLLGLGATIADQLIGEDFLGRCRIGEKCLCVTDDIIERPQRHGMVGCLKDERIARMETVTSADFGRNGNAPAFAKFDVNDIVHVGLFGCSMH
jgi:hypothetical protein